MKKLFSIAGLLLAGLLVSASASAYYVDGSVVRDSSGNGNQGKYTYAGYYFDLAGIHFGYYDGYIGNVDQGYPGSSPNHRIGTPFLVKGDDLTSVDSYANNSEDRFPVGTNNVHWYRFTSNTTSILDVYYEWDGGVDSFKLELFEYDGSDSAIATATFSSSFLIDPITGHIGHYDDLNFTNIAAGDYLVRVTGTSNHEINNGYSVYFETTAVPLPPAALLFISALTGLGVIGRRKSRKAI